jgi:hypothetical protein
VKRTGLRLALLQTSEQDREAAPFGRDFPMRAEIVGKQVFLFSRRLSSQVAVKQLLYVSFFYIHVILPNI